MWFRRDLRLAANPAWAAATSRHRRVVALFVIDPTLFDAAGPTRRSQLVAELEALDTSLTDLGGRLVVRVGDPCSLVPAVAEEVA